MRVRLSIVVGCIGAFCLSAGAVAQGGSQAGGAAGSQSQTPPTDNPFAASRGPAFAGATAARLKLSILGLGNGSATIGGGMRDFGICWKGGDGPYAVNLTDAAGETLVHETGVGTTFLIKASRPVLFAPGAYSIEVQDAKGTRAMGRFTVVPDEDLPYQVRAPGDAGAPPRSRYSGVDLTRYSYELYLQSLPRVIAADHGATETAGYFCNLGG